MSRIITIGQDRDLYREPPGDVVRALREAFPECFLEWKPRAKRWVVMRRVPQNDIDRLVSAKKLCEADIDAARMDRKLDGYDGDSESLVVYAFTVQDPVTGEYIEPGSWLIDVLRRADTQDGHVYENAQQALMAHINERKAEEAAKDVFWKDQIDQAVTHFEPWLMQNPRMFYPDQEKGRGNVSDRGSSPTEPGQETPGPTEKGSDK